MPWPDRTYGEWKKEVDEDVNLVIFYLHRLDEPDATKDDKTLALAMARKEARRLERDIERIGSETLGITREEIDRVRT